MLRIARAVNDDELVALALREQARVEAGAASVDAARAMLTEARTRFEQLGEPSESRATEVVLAEVLLDHGRCAEAQALLDDLARRATPAELEEVAAGFHRLSALLQAADGRLDEARRWLQLGLAAAEAADDRYEQALALTDLAVLAARMDEPEREVLQQRADAILEDLGVLTLSGR